MKRLKKTTLWPLTTQVRFLLTSFLQNTKLELLDEFSQLFDPKLFDVNVGSLNNNDNELNGNP